MKKVCPKCGSVKIMLSKSSKKLGKCLEPDCNYKGLCSSFKHTSKADTNYHIPNQHWRNFTNPYDE